VSVGGYSEMFLDKDNEIDVQPGAKGVQTFESMLHAGGGNNPTDVKNLTPEQKKIALGLRFDHTSGVSMKFGVSGGHDSRNLFFTGASSMACSPDETKVEFVEQLHVSGREHFIRSPLVLALAVSGIFTGVVARQARLRWWPPTGAAEPLLEA